MSLTRRILAVNFLPIILLAGSLLYLDVIRERLIEERLTQSVEQVRLLATVFAQVPSNRMPLEARRIGRAIGARIRVVGPNGKIIADSWVGQPPNITIGNPAQEGLERRAAALLDDGIDAIVRAPSPSATQHRKALNAGLQPYWMMASMQLSEPDLFPASQALGCRWTAVRKYG
jgi:two-component system sensor histidine kinase ChvG